MSTGGLRDSSACQLTLCMCVCVKLCLLAHNTGEQQQQPRAWRSGPGSPSALRRPASLHSTAWEKGGEWACLHGLPVRLVNPKLWP